MDSDGLRLSARPAFSWPPRILSSHKHPLWAKAVDKDIVTVDVLNLTPVGRELATLALHARPVVERLTESNE
jgi:hypothetical protein